MPTIVTASWFTRLPEGYVRVGISRGTPRRSIGPYRRYPKLNPGPWCFEPMPAEDWSRLYQDEILSKLDPHQVARDLARIADGGGGVLCCFEAAGGPQWCHRALAAEWLSRALETPVPEFGFEDQALHPLRPPAPTAR